MRISCPNCTATYDVPAELAAGRPVVRCVQCAQEWKLGQAPAQANRPVAEAAPLLNPIPAEILGRAREPNSLPAADETLLIDRIAPGTEAGDLEFAAAPDKAAALVSEEVAHDLEAATVVAEDPSAPPAEATSVATEAAAAIDRVRSESTLRMVLASIAGNLVAVAGWAISLGLVLALGWFAVQHRTGIMHAWPPSQRLFNWLGLA